jgi:hypothetical protein
MSDELDMPVCGAGAALKCILERGHDGDHTNGPCRWANFEPKDTRQPVAAPGREGDK